MHEIASKLTLAGSSEKKLVAFINNNIVTIISLTLIAIGVILRFDGRGFVSGDYRDYFSKWYVEAVEKGGLLGLGGDMPGYNMPYQTILAIMTYVPVSKMAAFKIPSCVFDILMSASCAMLAKRVAPEGGYGKYPLLVFAATFISPLCILNSAYWGQCESMYATFCILSIVCCLDKHYYRGFILFGVSLALKPQAIMLLPFYFVLYVYESSFSLVCFTGIPIGMILSSLPQIIAGRSIFDVFTWFFGIITYRYMYMNYPNIWALISIPKYGDSPAAIELAFSGLHVFSTLLTLAVLFVICGYYVYQKKHLLKSPLDMLKLSAIIVFTCAIFLPTMHERYGYLSEILLIMIAVLDRKYAPVAVLAQLPILAAYSIFLFHTNAQIEVWAAFNCFIWLALLIQALRDSGHTSTRQALN